MLKNFFFFDFHAGFVHPTSSYSQQVFLRMYEVLLHDFYFFLRVLNSAREKKSIDARIGSLSSISDRPIQALETDRQAPKNPQQGGRPPATW